MSSIQVVGDGVKCTFECQYQNDLLETFTEQNHLVQVKQISLMMQLLKVHQMYTQPKSKKSTAPLEQK